MPAVAHAAAEGLGALAQGGPQAAQLGRQAGRRLGVLDAEAGERRPGRRPRRGRGRRRPLVEVAAELGGERRHGQITTVSSASRCAAIVARSSSRYASSSGSSWMTALRRPDYYRVPVPSPGPRARAPSPPVLRPHPSGPASRPGARRRVSRAVRPRCRWRASHGCRGRFRRGSPSAASRREQTTSAEAAELGERRVTGRSEGRRPGPRPRREGHR